MYGVHACNVGYGIQYEVTYNQTPKQALFSFFLIFSRILRVFYFCSVFIMCGKVGRWGGRGGGEGFRLNWQK